MQVTPNDLFKNPINLFYKSNKKMGSKLIDFKIRASLSSEQRKDERR